MRAIVVTGDRTDLLEVDITEDHDRDLSGVTIRLGLSTSQSAPPATWHEPQLTYPRAGATVATLPITEAIAPPGLWWVWVDVDGDATDQPVVAPNQRLRTT